MKERLSFNLQFILIEDQKTTLLQIARGLKKADPEYRFESSEYFLHGNDLLAQVQIYHRGEDLFRSQIEWLRYRASSQDKPAKEPVLQMLENASRILFFQVLQVELSAEQALPLFSPLWDWLFTHRKGLLYVDAEGFWDAEGLLLPDDTITLRKSL